MEIDEWRRERSWVHSTDYFYGNQFEICHCVLKIANWLIKALWLSIYIEKQHTIKSTIVSSATLRFLFLTQWNDKLLIEKKRWNLLFWITKTNLSLSSTFSSERSKSCSINTSFLATYDHHNVAYSVLSWLVLKHYSKSNTNMSKMS